MNAATRPSRDTAGASWAPEVWSRIFVLLDRALELEGDARTTWVDALAETHVHDAEAVRALLDQRRMLETDDFLGARPHLALPTSPSAAAPGDDAQRVGPYRLLREIGRGGTATVWLAERVDGLVARQVALKRPDVSWHCGSALAERMTRERRILASLAHPNIARLYDAGIELSGRPYLALEYVDGLPIDAFADRHGLSVRQRVALIRDVARAVGYAHGQLVVHRDLKPSNLLVDAHGTVHLVDFGIAKLIDAGSDLVEDGSQLTLMAGRPLTPDYASPEQIRGDPIGTASDVYSLGIVAFELLSGQRPYRLEIPTDERSFAAMLARIDIPRASTVASDTERARSLRGDLDAMLRKMLGALPSERYPTMDALADDLDRHLSGAPVHARAGSRAYVLRRWMRRHKLASGIGVALLIALAGGAYAQVLIALAIAAGALMAIWQRDQALKQAALARAALERGEQVKNFVASIFTQAVPRAGQGGTVAATDLLKAAARRVETDLVGQPAVAAELGVLIGTSLNELGDLAAALAWLPKAVDLCERQFGSTHPMTLRARQRWIEAANLNGDIALTGASIPALLRDLRAARPAEPQLLVEALRSHAFVLTKAGREADAFAALREAIDIAVAHAGEGSAIALRARESMANTFAHFGRHGECLETIEQAIAPAYALYGAQRPHPLLTAVERGHGDALAHNQRPREATLILRQVVADQRALDVIDTTRVRVALHMLARALLHRGQYDEAIVLFGEATAMQHRLVGLYAQESMAGSLWLALACGLRGDGHAALAALAPAIAAVDGQTDGPSMRASLTMARALGEVVLGRNDAALASIDAARATGIAQPATIDLRMTRIRCMALRQSGAVERAAVLARSTLAHIDPRCIALEHGLLLVEAARCSATLGEADEVRRLWSAALAVWDRGQVDGDELRRPLISEFGAR